VLFDPELDPPGPAVGVLDPANRLLAWLRARERLVLRAAIAFQLIVLGGMVALNAIPWFGGRTVLLHVVPVDPRDLMRGEYVTLGYDINQIPPAGIQGPNGPMSADEWQGRPVFVVLVPDADGRHFRGGDVFTETPAQGVYIRGTVSGRNQITFGIESYFVQEGQGKDYEKAVRERRLSAEVALAGSGAPALRRLVFD
jgi:uncharacterized membrane-anchored protein